MRASPRGEERATSFVVGGNVPWLNCGWDFGPAPVGFGEASRDFAALVEELRELRRAGLRVLRWWILAGGANYPVGGRVERVASLRGDPWGRAHWTWRPGQGPVPLGEAFLRDVVALCDACRAAGLRLWPSLLSFEWFLPATRFSRGRGPLVFGEGSVDPKAAVERFLDATLSPLLQACAGYRDVIHAFEVINEPDWVTQGGPWLGPSLGGGRVPAAHMRALLSAGVARIASAGCVASVGFARLSPRWIGGDLHDQLGRLAVAGRYLHQVHHYPHLLGARPLPPASQSPFLPVYVGEFPSGLGRRVIGCRPGHAVTNAPWPDPELRQSERDAAQYLAGRLRLIRDRGYAGALLWATPLRATRMRSDPRCTFTPELLGQVRSSGVVDER